MIFDRDLDTTNDARFYWHDESAVDAWRAPTGMLNNYCPIGSSLLWVPFVLLVHSVVQGDGFSFPYPAAAAFGSALLAWLALVALYRRFRDLAVVVAIWLGSNLGYYMSIEALASHACSFAVVTFFFLEDRPLRKGILLGLAMLVRPEYALLAALVNWRSMIVAAALFLPQLLVWKHVTGSWISPVAGTAGWPVHVPEVLFSTRHGAFLWHPVYLLGALGLLAPGDRKLRWRAALVIAGAAVFYGTRHAWWGFHSFGGRYFVGLGAFFAIGLAHGAVWLRRRWLVWSLVAALLVWNASLLLLYVSRTISQSEAVPLETLLLAPLHALRLFPAW